MVLGPEDGQAEEKAEQELKNCSSEMGNSLEKKISKTDNKGKEKDHSKASGTVQSKQAITQELQQEIDVENQGEKETVEGDEPETGVPCDDHNEQETQVIEGEDMTVGEEYLDPVAVEMVETEVEEPGEAKRKGLSGVNEQKDGVITETAGEVGTQGVPTPICQEVQVIGI